MDPKHLAAACVLTLLLAGPAAGGSFFRGDLRHRPRLAFDARDPAHIQRVIARVAAQEEPWAAAYRRLRDRAEQGAVVPHGSSGWQGQSDKWAALYGQETRNGEIAAAQALVAWLYTQGLDPAWRPLPRLPGESSPDGWCRARARDARRTIAGMYCDWPCWRGFGPIGRGIVAADSLTMHALAYDLLAALPSSWRGDLSGAERRLGDFAADLRYWGWTLDSYNANHAIRLYSGLGVAAIVLNRHDRYRWYRPGTWWHRPSGWMSKVERKLHPTRRGSKTRHVLRQGADAEGSSYWHYAADLHLPFASGYARFLQGGGVPFLRSDLLSDAALWMVQLRLPDGRRPPVDNATFFKDSTPAYFLSRVPGGARSAADQALLHWDWRDAGTPGIGGRRAAFLLGSYDPSSTQLQQLAPPTWRPTRTLAREGSAVLRTDWGRDAAHVHVQAQHGELRRHGEGHESVANGAYTFYAHGDLVTLDPGYFGFSGVERTNRAEHRSMVLVNGKGPKPAHRWLGFLHWVSGGTDTRIRSGARTQAGPDVRAVAVGTEYEGAEIERTLALVSERYLLVEDRCRAKRRRSKRFTTIVQANAGRADGIPLQRSGAVVRYETRARRLPVCVGSTATSSLSTAIVARDSRMGEGPDGHDAIEYSARGREVRFLTAIAAERAGGSPPDVRAIPLAAGALALRIEVGGRVDLAVSNPARAAIRVPAQTGTRELNTRRELVIVSFDASGQGRTLWSVGSGSLSY